MNLMDANTRELEELGLTPAMLTALFHKPHDRQFIVELENSVTSFVDSNAESYELRPMNSYYRLLSHQVAEYHNLKHVLARTHDNCVIIFKGDGFSKKEDGPLLQELQPLCMIPCPPVVETEAKIGKRYRILKRRDGEVASTSIPNSGEEEEDEVSDVNDSEATLEQQRFEREQQYEQRKQEIFHTPKKNSSGGEEEDENPTLDNTSPQPYQFETSRYRFNQRDSNQQQQQQQQSHGNGNSRRNRKRHSVYQDSKRSSSPGSFALPYVMYPAPPVAPSNGSQQPPQFPYMYPAPFHVDGANGYMAPYMYQPMQGTISPGFGPMAYPLPYQYGQPPPMYCQYQSPYRTHVPHHRRDSKNGSSSSNSRSSFSKHPTERTDNKEEAPSSASTMVSAATEVDDLAEEMQKLPT